MKRINKQNSPEEWEQYKKKYPQKRYKDLESDLEIDLRRTLRESLLKEQGYICAYCSSSICDDKTGLRKAVNEHILPQDSYPQQSMEYSNIVASCDYKLSCTNLKKNKYAPLLVSPLDDDCETYFMYHFNGEIIGKDEKGEFTVNLLGLNTFKLVQARRAIIKCCIDLNDKELIKEHYIDLKDGKFPSYCDMVKYFYDEGFFDD